MVQMHRARLLVVGLRSNVVWNVGMSEGWGACVLVPVPCDWFWLGPWLVRFELMNCTECPCYKKWWWKLTLLLSLLG